MEDFMEKLTRTLFTTRGVITLFSDGGNMSYYIDDESATSLNLSGRAPSSAKIFVAVSRRWDEKGSSYPKTRQINIADIESCVSEEPIQTSKTEKKKLKRKNHNLEIYVPKRVKKHPKVEEEEEPESETHNTTTYRGD